IASPGAPPASSTARPPAAPADMATPNTPPSAAPTQPAAAATMLSEPSRGPRPPMPEPEPEPFWMDPMVLGGAAGALLLIGVLVFMRRRSAGPRYRSRARRAEAA
ncbi:MAG: hypothetical protein WCK28_21535, partial [Burkholderiales bacterium]